MLATSPVSQDRGLLQLHAVLNLLNRLNGTRDTAVREELITRMAEYLTAVHRAESTAHVALSGLCELTRSYAAMRYLMADAIEPRFSYGERDLQLRTEQVAAMAVFLQRAVDSLLEVYVPRLALSIEQHAIWQVQLTLTIDGLPGSAADAPAGWTADPRGTSLTRSARFVARARQLPRT